MAKDAATSVRIIIRGEMIEWFMARDGVSRREAIKTLKESFVDAGECEFEEMMNNELEWAEQQQKIYVESKK